MMEILNHQSGFVAGTLVHTDQGLVPIEQLKAGDLVLSMPEEGVGEKAYKKVLETLISENKKNIFAIKFISEHSTDETGSIEYLFSAGSCQFLKQDLGYVNADQLCMGDQLADVNKDILYIYDDVLPIFLFSNNEKLGYSIYSEFHPLVGEYPGIAVIDFNKKPSLIYIDDESYYESSAHYEDKKLWHSNNHITLSGNILNDIANYYFVEEKHHYNNDLYMDNVFSLKVEDYQSYFVGIRGVWVKA